MSLADKGLVSFFCKWGRKRSRTAPELLKVTRLFCGRTNTGRGLPPCSCLLSMALCHFRKPLLTARDWSPAFHDWRGEFILECIVRYVFNTVFTYSFPAPQSWGSCSWWSLLGRECVVMHRQHVIQRLRIQSPTFKLSQASCHSASLQSVEPCPF